MAKSKKKIIESLAAVKNVGPKYAEAAYEELEIRSVDELIAAAEKGKLQKLSGIGAKKEKAILESAKSTADSRPAKTPSKPKTSPKSSTSKPSKPKSEPASSAKSAKKDKREPARAEAKNDDKAGGETRSERPKASTRPRPGSNYSSRERKKKSSNPIVFVGKLVFKIAKKLLS